MGMQASCCSAASEKARRTCAFQEAEADANIFHNPIPEDCVTPDVTPVKPTELKVLSSVSAESAVSATTTEEPGADHGVSAGSAADSASEADEFDEEQEAEFVRQMRRTSTSEGYRRQRVPVFAEQLEVDRSWEAPVYDKTPEQQAWLSKALTSSFLFADLGKSAIDEVIKAFQDCQVRMNEIVIKQGATVQLADPALFVLETGKLEAFKDGIASPVFTYDTPGQYFGDLALLYNAPRAATVIAKRDNVKLWWIDRSTYNYLVKDAANLAMERRLGLLKKVSVLRGLTDDERATLCDSLQERTYEAGDAIIRQGTEGTEFFIVDSGRCEARRGSELLYTFTERSYFGELALIRRLPRAADVIATEQTVVLVLDAGTFARLLGSLEAIMEERAAEYGEITISSVKRSSVVYE